MPYPIQGYIVLLLIIPLGMAAFATMRPTRAMLTVMLGTMLFGPERVSFNPPIVPDIGKMGFASILCMVFAYAKIPDRVRSARLFRGPDLLIIAMMLGLVFTVLTNMAPDNQHGIVRPGLTGNDILQHVFGEFIGFVLPYWVGRIYLRDHDDAKDLAGAVILGGLVYLPFCVIELMNGPVCHATVYGFLQHSYEQTVRSGGFRPMVFMEHGLGLAMMLFGACSTAWVAHRTYGKLGNHSLLPAALLLTTFMFLIHSSGALVFTILAVPLLLFLPPRIQLQVASVMATGLLLYPALRMAGLVPAATIADWAAKTIGHERAGSLWYRLMNEDQFLARTVNKPLFGWGGQGRMFVIDPNTKLPNTVDGCWIGLFATLGWVGFLTHFGMLLTPIWMAKRRFPEVDPAVVPLLSGLALIQAFLVLDLIPNGLFSPFALLLAGALLGLSDGLRQRSNRLMPLLAAYLLLRRRKTAAAAAAAAKASG